MRQPQSKSHIGPSLLVFVAAAFWGLYWLPLRSIEGVGITTIWAVIAVYLIPFICMLPLLVARVRTTRSHWLALSVIAVPIGAGLAFYAMAFLYTSVMRTTLLFYLTPIWSTLLAMIFLGEKTVTRRWVAMAVGFLGLAIMLLDGSSSSTDGFNRGDVAAILAGVLWGFGTVMVRKSPQISAIDIVPAQYFFAVVVSGLFLLWETDPIVIPTTRQWLDAMPYLVGFYVIIMLPSLYICIRCSQILSPGRVGILMMSEVLVAGISATLLAGESLTSQELIATTLILCAGALEVTTPTRSLPAKAMG